MKVSIIVPVYNCEQWLARCLDSIVEQTIDPFEIICIDDASTDTSLEILMNYQKKYRNIVLLKSKVNQGAGNARNMGLQKAIGTYVCFMDADDWYHSPTVLNTLFIASENNNALICGGNRAICDKNGAIQSMCETVFTHEGFVNTYDLQESNSHGRYLYNRKMLIDNGIFFPKYRRYEDPSFLIRAHLEANYIYCLPITVYMNHKRHFNMQYTRSVTIDILHGILDCVQIASINNLNKLLKRFGDTMKSYEKYYMKYLYDGDEEIWEILQEIYQYYRKDERMSYINIHTKQTIALNLRLYQIEKTKFNAFVTNNNVLVYGAGKCGQKIIRRLKKMNVNLVGVAVSQKCKENKSNDIHTDIHEIKEYVKLKNQINVLIAVYDTKIANEMIRILKQYEFKNFAYFNYTELDIDDFLIKSEENNDSI